MDTGSRCSILLTASWTGRPKSIENVSACNAFSMEASSAKGNLKPGTSKYLDKIKALKDILQKGQDDLTELKNSIIALEQNILRTKGAISILVELAAEEEGML